MDFQVLQQRVNHFLEQQLNLSNSATSRLQQAMAYSLMAGGKRIRPLLVYATAKSVGTDLTVADNIAAAVEMIHAYSLIHDDLPAMDDDELRRGQATNHIAFDEATAILAGDALQSLAFETIASTPTSPDNVIQLVKKLAQASGFNGMAGGQSLDLEAENKLITLSQLQNIHALKTGALLKIGIELVLLTQPKLAPEISDLYINFATELGISFQIKDDLLDVTGDTHTLGKPAKSDTRNHKSTYPSLLGLNKAQQQANKHIDNAYQALQQIPQDTTALLQLAQLVIDRDH